MPTPSPIRHFAISLIAISLASGGSPVLAQSTSALPPGNALKLSTIIAKVEMRPGFQYIERIQWFNDSYIVTFHTLDKARVEMNFDPVTGQSK